MNLRKKFDAAKIKIKENAPVVAAVVSSVATTAVAAVIAVQLREKKYHANHGTCLVMTHDDYNAVVNEGASSLHKINDDVELLVTKWDTTDED